MRSLALKLGPLVLLWGGVAAADACFCLQDAADRLWYDCTKYYKPPSPDPFYDCYPSTQAREPERVPKGHTMTPIRDGLAPCRPCRAADWGFDNTMRPLTPKSGPSGAAPGAGHE